jgi:3-oxoacyl-[acyl-carrier-protein] synthase II
MTQTPLPDSQRVVVTGLGATTPLGGDVPTTWSAMLAGRSGVRVLT